MKRSLLVSTLIIGLTWTAAAVQDEASAAKLFQARLDEYVEMHRRLEGPLPPLMTTTDMGEVRRLMAALRLEIRRERADAGQGHVFTSVVVDLLRAKIGSCLSPEEIDEAIADVEEHTPPKMPIPRVNEPLPADAPFGLLPPELLRTLPQLPPELRYMVLSKGLVLWDHHADLVVDIAPGLFDPETYRKRGQLKR